MNLPNAITAARIAVAPAIVSVSLDNTGTVRAEGCNITFNGPVVQILGGALTGGTWEVADGGSIFFTPGGFTRIDGAKPTWVPDGTSDKQAEARRLARAEIAQRPTPANVESDNAEGER